MLRVVTVGLCLARKTVCQIFDSLLVALLFITDAKQRTGHVVRYQQRAITHHLHVHRVPDARRSSNNQHYAMQDAAL